MGDRPGCGFANSGFLYLNAMGLADAKKDKARFLAKTNISLPLIKITLPTTQAEEVKFEYVAGDN